VSTAGVYISTLISAGGCDSIITTTLNITSPTTTNEDILLCTGSSYILPDGTEVFSAGTYTSNLFSVAGCDSIIITNLAFTDGFAVTVDTSMLEGQTYTLPDGISVNEAGTYISNLISTGGCDSIVTTHLTIIQTVFDVDVPNAFSPNGDGVNDVFHINSNDVLVNSFTVYNRWGQLIYEAENGIVAWDGRLNGIEQEVGMFIYILKYTTDSDSLIKTGTVTLIR
jgi:gliding motility-associated-like protein